MTDDVGIRPIRRGLPRVSGGPPWPDVAQVQGRVPTPAAAAAPEGVPMIGSPHIRRGLPRAHEGNASPLVSDEAAGAALAAAAPAVALTVPAPGPTATQPPTALVPAPPALAPSSERRLFRGFTMSQWVWRAIGGFVAIVIVLGILVLAARGLTTFQWVRDFLHTYPGDYPLPKGAPIGFPAWVNWQHFLNAFFLLLIIRSGIQVRREQRPKASWSPRWNPNRKISLTVWFHQSLDLLWFVNGAVFFVLLFSTGQWMRVIPTSWSVLPNAISAAVQYASLNWPTDDGWSNYNSLQQLTYCTTIFFAAPLAAVTGARMSGLWPKKARRLSRLYTVSLARAIHFPVMIYFVAFIVVHVALVFATGALRNLNHMYGGSDNVNWVGFWIFVPSLAVMAAGWIAARPLVIASIARLFGKVGR